MDRKATNPNLQISSNPLTEMKKMKKRRKMQMRMRKRRKWKATIPQSNELRSEIVESKSLSQASLSPHYPHTIPLLYQLKHLC